MNSAPDSPREDPSGLRLFAAAIPGFEAVTLEEVRGLGVRDAEVVSGGVEFVGSAPMIARANLRLRSASAVLLRVGQLKVGNLKELRKRAQRFTWSNFLDRRAPLAIRVSTRASRIYHKEAAAQRLRQAIGASLGAFPPEPSGGIAQDDADAAELEEGTQTLLLRIDGSAATLSLDTTGAPLHRRGYRLAGGPAPLREHLAAALLLDLGYRGDCAFADPFCGSGTLAIEAALIASGRAPGLGRNFNSKHGPMAGSIPWEEERERAAAPSDRSLPPIYASDRDAGAVERARQNAQRAGVQDLIRFEEAAFGRSALPPGPGLLLSNPPFGRRLKSPAPLRNLYAALGKHLRALPPGWRGAFLCSDRELARRAGAGIETLRTGIPHGGLSLRMHGTPAAESEPPAP